MECRSGCGACCIAPSISSPIPGMPNGKAAGVPCAQLDKDMRCKIFNHPDRPAVCSEFRAEPLICGKTAEEAMACLSALENT